MKGETSLSWKEVVDQEGDLLRLLQIDGETLARVVPHGSATWRVETRREVHGPVTVWGHVMRGERTRCFWAPSIAMRFAERWASESNGTDNVTKGTDK